LKGRDLKSYPYLPQREKKRRAFEAYVSLLETAEWMHFDMADRLAAFNLTLMQFRVMEFLLRDGPAHQSDIGRKFRCSVQAISYVIRRLEKKGWVRRVPAMLPTSRTKESEDIARRARRRGRKIEGRRVILVKPTRAGKDWVGEVFIRHAKVVRSYMRALQGRELLTLKRLCDKLREGDLLRFYKEITRVDYKGEELRVGDLVFDPAESARA
jgi:MarR family transcriptional regulator, 2-MHQ and catechol-resistance regulon repressor